MLVHFFDIQWDTDGAQERGEIDLPESCTLEVSDDTDLENSAADCLSDEYGWCVYACDYLKQPTPKPNQVWQTKSGNRVLIVNDAANQRLGFIWWDSVDREYCFSTLENRLERCLLESATVQY